MAMLEFKKRGGGYDRARIILDRVYGRGEKNDDAGSVEEVPDKGHAVYDPASSPKASGFDQSDRAQPGQMSVVKPVRPPIDLTGPIALGMKNVLAKSVFDRVKTSDGRSWGDVGAHELDGMSRDGVMAKAIKSHIGVLSPSQHNWAVRDLISSEVFEKIRSETNAS
jgi:hypothetical protein